MGIKRLFDRAHHIPSGTVFGLHKLFLTDPDAMFARAGAAIGQRTLCHTIRQGKRRFMFRCIFRIKQ